jgi:N6-adenosine-specific RNA methylase IME4
MNELALRDVLKKELQQIKDIETGIEYLKKVKAVEVYAKAKKDEVIQNMAAEQKIRTQRLCGELIQDGQQRGEIAKPGGDRDSNVPDRNNGTKTLSDIGISRKESSIFQKLADIPKEIFEDSIKEKKEAINKGASELTTTSMMKVANESKKQQRKEELKDVVIEKTDKKYRIIYADCPWKYNEVQHQTEGNFQSKILGHHYPSMSISELCELPIKDLTEKNAIMFFWVTSPLLEECFSVIKAWGFKYKTSMIWDKVKHNVGNYVSVRHELLLICTKGSCTPDVKKLDDSVYSEERTEHSKKPKYFRNLIDRIYTEGNRIELFAREENPGWDKWGNEV